MNYNPELVRALAHGDEQAHEQIKDLPLLNRMAIGAAVDEMRRTENIVPMSSGMSIYEEQPSKYVSDDDVRASMQRMMDDEKENRRLAKEATEKIVAEQTRAAIERGRAGLKRNDTLRRQ